MQISLFTYKILAGHVMVNADKKDLKNLTGVKFICINLQFLRKKVLINSFIFKTIWIK